MPIQGSFHELCFISLSVWVIITKADFQITLKQLYRRCRVLTCCSEWRPGTLMDIMSTSSLVEFTPGLSNCCWLLIMFKWLFIRTAKVSKQYQGRYENLIQPAVRTIHTSTFLRLWVFFFFGFFLRGFLLVENYQIFFTHFRLWLYTNLNCKKCCYKTLISCTEVSSRGCWFQSSLFNFICAIIVNFYYFIS